VSLEGLFALPRTARVTTFFLSPCFYQTTPLRARSLLRAFTPQTPLGTLGKPSAVSVVIPLKSSYRNPFRGFSGWPAPAASSALPSPSAAGLFIPSPCWRAEKSIIPHLFVNFFRPLFCVRLFPPPPQYPHNLHIMNSICFCHTASFHRIFF